VITVTGVEVILAALAAGAGAGTSDAAKAAVVDAYTGLRDALRQRLTGPKPAQQVLDAVQSEPGTWQNELGPQLEQSGAAHDEEILAAARRVLALADPAGSSAGKYQIDAREAKGVQIGDYTTQHNDFRTTINVNDPHAVHDVPIIVTVKDYSRSSRLIVDGDPPRRMTLSGQLAVEVTVEGRSSQAVTLERIQPVVLERREPRLAMIMEDPLDYKRVTLRYIEVDLAATDLGLSADDFTFTACLDAGDADVRAEVSPRRWLYDSLLGPSRRLFGNLFANRLVAPDGTPQGPVLPHGGFPYAVTASDPERFIFRPQVTGHEVGWRMRIEWLCAGRHGTTVVDNDGQPFWLYPRGQDVTRVPFRAPGRPVDNDYLLRASPPDVQDMWNRYWSIVDDDRRE
jgi:hypothetical protein